jgi:orotidine-5'-phosphate decarboxylase
LNEPSAAVVVRSVCSAPSTVMVTPFNGRLTNVPGVGPGSGSEANTRPTTAAEATGAALKVSKKITRRPPGRPSPSASIACPFASRTPVASNVTRIRAPGGRFSR